MDWDFCKGFVNIYWYLVKKRGKFIFIVKVYDKIYIISRFFGKII